MLTDGALMRLGKQDFRELLNEPMLHWVDYDDARRPRRPRRASGSTCGCPRVREPSHRRRDERAAVLHPPEAEARSIRTRRTSSLRHGTPQLGRAFILNERGYDAYVLQGGLADALGPG
jgi:hypothetical protein